MSLRSIAEALGLSITTVSRALSGYSDVALATRKRIFAEAERIGYEPNELARRLQKGRADAIGLVIPSGPEGFQSPFYLKIVEGAWRRLEVSAMDLLVMSAPPGATEDRLYRRLVGGRVDGVILMRTLVEDHRVRYLKERDFPFLVFGPCTEQAREHLSVGVNERLVVETALAHLTDLGHRRIVCLSASTSYAFAVERTEAMRDLGPRFGLEVEFRFGAMSEASGFSGLSSVLASHYKPTAAVAINDQIAIGAARAAWDAGLSPGRDIAIISLGDSATLEMNVPPITAVRLPLLKMAEHAVDVLIGWRDKQPVEHKRDWPVQLIVRESTAPGWAG